MSKLGLTQDEQEGLDTFVNDGHWPAMKKLLSALQQSFTNDVLNFNLIRENAGQELVITKARAEGAQNYFASIVQHLEKKTANDSKQVGN